MQQFRRGELVFDVIDEGPADGPVVVLLHGFPQFNDSWNAVIARLTSAGYRCLAPNQRGYSAGARPARRRDYCTGELVGDVRALIDASGAQRVHLVGHDWGGAAAWATAAKYPERLATLSALSVPHPAAFVRAMATSRQVRASWYMYAFQLPWIPERVLTGDGSQWHRFATLLQRSGQTPERAEQDARAMVERGAVTPAINWYRAMLVGNPNQFQRKSRVPTLFVWSDGDTAVLRKAADTCHRWVDAPYRYETLHGATHWMLDERPDDVADLLLKQFAAYPA
jgi:pimeloyl-ACP methyl ester carboxylesterase